jgi:hypothetical protein
MTSIIDLGSNNPTLHLGHTVKVSLTEGHG